MKQVLLAALLLMLAGCLSAGRPCDRLPPPVVEACRELPHSCRQRVHVFFLNGLDPFDCANLSHARRTALDLGFAKTHHGSLVHVPYFALCMKQLRDADPGAKFVIVGHGLGAEAAFALAAVSPAVERMVLIEAPGWTVAARSKPANVGELAFVRAKSWFNLPVGSSALHELDTGWTWAGPDNVLTLERLADELHRAGATIPYELPGEEVAERPQPPAPEGWAFLEPVARLAPTASPFAPAGQAVMTMKVE